MFGLPTTSPPAPADTPAASPTTTTKTAAGNTNAPTPYMRCVNDFWGNCTGVASNRHDYRWRYVRPGIRPRELRESTTARENAAAAGESVVARKGAAAPPRVKEAAAPRVKEPSPPRAKEAAAPAPPKATSRQIATTGNADILHEKDIMPAAPKAASRQIATTGNANIPMREKAALRERDTAVLSRDNTTVCHPRRRVVGEERPSQDDARRAAENGWMGAVRYDFGERYQDINRAKEVRLLCGPSSVSATLKTPYFRCAVEATPCRETQGLQTEPDERRYDPPVMEDRISRK